MQSEDGGQGKQVDVGGEGTERMRRGNLRKLTSE